MKSKQPSILDRLACSTNTSASDWEELDGPESGVGVDYWFRHRKTGAEAYANLDQDHLRISVEDEVVFDAIY
jgi:hypothetical protein